MRRILAILKSSERKDKQMNKSEFKEAYRQARLMMAIYIADAATKKPAVVVDREIRELNLALKECGKAAYYAITNRTPKSTYSIMDCPQAVKFNHRGW